jgi:hypothetical protein
MPILSDWNLIIDADQVIRGQGADPETIRARSPRIVEYAERAIVDGTSLLNPELIFRRMGVEKVLHERIVLESGDELRSPLLVQHLSPATEVLIILCTIGADLENKVSEIMRNDPPYGLALDGFGSAAVEALANAACHHFELESEEKRLETSIPLSPGMIDWLVEEGQAQIFKLLPAKDIGVSVTPSWIMLPRKSLSMIVGIGEKMTQAGTPCDFCTMRETCRYQNHYD